MAVNPAGRQQPHDVQAAAVLLEPLERPVQGSVAGKLALLDGAVDPRQVLIDLATGTEVHMTHFRIAHLVVRQAHVCTGARDQGVRLLRPVAVPVGRVRLGDGVVLRGWAIAESVQNHQQRRFSHGFLTNDP